MKVHAYGHNKHFKILPHVLSKQLQNQKNKYICIKVYFPTMLQHHMHISKSRKYTFKKNE